MVRSLMARRSLWARIGDQSFELDATQIPTADQPDLRMATPPRVRLARSVTLELAGYNCRYFVPVQSLEGGVLRLGDELWSLRRRRLHRASPKDPVEIEMDTPWGRFAGTLLDLSSDGLAVRLAEPKNPLQLGDTVQIYVPGQVHISATVQAVDQDRVGCSVEPESDGTGAWWAWVDPIVHPGVALHACTTADAMWSLYEDAGYFNLAGKQPEDFDDVKSGFTYVFDRLLAAPHLGGHFIWANHGEAEASATMLRSYAQTLAGCQLAKRPGRTRGKATRRQILANVFLTSIEHMIARNARWHVVSVRRSEATLARETYLAFANELPDAQACVVGEHFWQVHPTADPMPDQNTTVCRATQADRQRVLEAVDRTWPAAFADALDLVQGELELATIGAKWREAGLDRGREVWVARQHGQPVAAALLEWFEPGTHLYGIGDAVRILSLERQPNLKAVDALLSICGQRYAEMGRSSWFLVTPIGGYAPPNAQDLGEVDTILLAGEVLPSFVHDLIEWMAAR
ncbi:MAG: PilZ domain-containing protein [Myxococcota bacterium]